MMTRRTALFLTASPLLASAANGPGRTAMGVGTASYAQRSRADRENNEAQPLTAALNFLEYCHQIGAGGIQASIGNIGNNSREARVLRKTCEEYGMYFEASLRLPQDDSDLNRFDRQVRAAKDAGATVIRSVMLGGRRYETFDSSDAFQQFEQQSWTSLTLAEPTMRKRRMKLAIENHKDWRLDEMLAMLKRISSEYIGACVDTGNNIALLDDPMRLVEGLAPYAFSVHLKDMAVEEYEKGFLLSEVPFGEGFLDLQAIVAKIRQAQPRTQFTLEMITRDPLEIPILTEKYWATFDKLPGRDVGMMLALVRKNEKGELPRISHLPREEQLRIEDENVKKCLAFARDVLRL